MLVSAATDERLRDQARHLLAHLERQRWQPDFPRFSDIAFTLTYGRPRLPARLAFDAASVDDLLAGLRGYLDGEPAFGADDALSSWCAGGPDDLLPAPWPARRVPLPGYPFQPDRHWLPERGPRRAWTPQSWPMSSWPPRPRSPGPAWTPRRLCHRVHPRPPTRMRRPCSTTR
ncbi:hypothetical protein ACFQ1L_34215 [Phytohabitans flavus]|uniref:KS-MAT linker domain-containing protein n=1 Tax=Phytohabitans flavus TaxID=1076124 RepID=UPI003633198F